MLINFFFRTQIIVDFQFISNKIIIILLFLFLPINLYPAKVTPFSFKDRLLRPLSADMNEVKIDFIILDERRINASIGGIFPILDWEIKNSKNNDILIQTGLFGVTFNRLNNPGGLRFNLETNDSIFGPYLDIQKGRSTYSIMYVHISTHLSEGVVDDNKKLINVSSKRYSREYLKFIYSLDFDLFRIYASPGITASITSPEEFKKRYFFAGQIGGEVQLPQISIVHPYFSFDFNFKQELSFYLNKSIALGFMFTGQSKRTFRIHFSYYQGYDPRGNFYDKKTEFFGGGIAFFY